ncbi:MAG: YlxR family protein [Solirubrobacter sp.]|nr:YlxR family protein [Candidatus Aquicultor secundus]NCO65571.1 YlxR family protein [Solirubrobacter sp.]
MAQAKKLPQRTCTGCREIKPKKALIRIVRTPEKNIIVDPTGKANGRGAYICPRKECLEAAIKSKRLSKALEVEIRPEELKKLEEELEALIKASGE